MAIVRVRHESRIYPANPFNGIAMEPRNDPQSTPAETGGWNWGAFLLTWIWGIGNNTFVAFLAFVPFVNFIMPFVLGAKGNAWAWRNKKWESAAAFRRTQRQWAVWGAIVWVGCLAACLLLFVGIFASLKQSEAYVLGVQALSASDEAHEILGESISTGIPTGSVDVNGSEGEAHLSFSASGTHGRGAVHVNAKKARGHWYLDGAVFEDNESGRQIELGRPEG